MQGWEGAGLGGLMVGGFDGLKGTGLGELIVWWCMVGGCLMLAGVNG